MAMFGILLNHGHIKGIYSSNFWGGKRMDDSMSATTEGPIQAERSGLWRAGRKEKIKGVSGMVKWPFEWLSDLGSSSIISNLSSGEFPSWMFSYIGRARRQAFFVGVLMEDGKRQMMTFYLEE